MHNTIQLVIANIPEGLLVPRIGDSTFVPSWNEYATWKKFLLSIFIFVESYLDDDGALLLILSIGLQEQLASFLTKYRM